MVIDLVIVNRAEAAGIERADLATWCVLEMAPAKVLQGAVRLQGLASLPVPETHVRLACAVAGCVPSAKDNAAEMTRNNLLLGALPSPPLVESTQLRPYILHHNVP